jgi:hypothetical protein
MFIRTSFKLLKRHGLLLSVAAGSLAVGTTMAAAPEHPKITKEQATKIALARVLGGTIKKGMIVSEQTENPSQQAAESQEDKKQGRE